MKKSLDIEKLRRKRQLNVAEQNAVTRQGLFDAATWFRTNTNEVPTPVLSFLKAQGLDLSQAIDVDFEDMASVGLGGFYSGLMVTQDHHFWRWEVELDETRSNVVSVEEWCDVTCEYPISEHLPGTGMSFGSMCIDVLRELNATQQAVASDRAKPRVG